MDKPENLCYRIEQVDRIEQSKLFTSDFEFLGTIGDICRKALLTSLSNPFLTIIFFNATFSPFVA